MFRKILVGTLLTAVALTMVATASTNSPEAPEESITFVYGKVAGSNAKRVNIVVGTSDREKFLSDPSLALRKQGVVVPQPAETHWRGLTVSLRRLANPDLAKPAGHNTSNEQVYFKITLVNNPDVTLTIVGDGSSNTMPANPRNSDPNRFLSEPVATLRARGVEVAAGDEPAWRQFADSLREMRNFPSFLRIKRDAEKPQESDDGDETNSDNVASKRSDPKKKPSGDPDRPVIVGSTPNSEAKSVGESGQPSSSRYRPITFPKRIDKNTPSTVQPDLSITEFLFPPTNNKALRVHIVNTGQAVSGACRLLLTVRKINGAAVGRTIYVVVPAMRAGKDVWLFVDANSILPNNVSLESTTFKLNVDATGLIAESDESNNELWHNQ